jgi:hypothetical protein
MTKVMTRLVSRSLLTAALLIGATTVGAQAPAGRVAVPAPKTATGTAPVTPTPAPLPQPAPTVAPTAMPGEPALGRLRVFEDWAVGCDNRLTCSAVSLIPAGAGDAYSVLVWIERAGGPEGKATLELSGAYELRGKIDLAVDNEAAGQLTAARDRAQAVGPTAFSLIRRLGSSYTFQLRQGKNAIAAPSLSGLAEALRYIDEVQGRLGSEAALAAIGDRPADQARALPNSARVPLAIEGKAPTTVSPLTPDEEMEARRLAICGGRPRTDQPISLHPLDSRHLLVLLACDPGADNVSSVVLVAEGEPGARTFRIAHFDLMPGFTGEAGTPPLIVNAQWNPAQAALSSFARGRPLGDCGTSETYRWDGAMFRLTEARAMPVCRGAWLWPVIWSADAVEAAQSAVNTARR